MKGIFVLWSTLMLLVCCGKSQTSGSLSGYNLQKTEASFVLPDSLREISGITDITDDKFACIQDENGIVFIFDTETGKIVHRYAFNIDGDYEDITTAGKSLYILRSDGTLFQITGYDTSGFKVITFITGIMTADNEGLCFDHAHNRLLVAAKSNAGKGPELKDIRIIYEFDVTTGTLGTAYRLNTGSILSFARDQHIQLPTRQTKKGNKLTVFKLRASGIDIHPLTGDLYLLSAVDHMLCVFDTSGIIRQLAVLDPLLFNKPEGITFLDNGDMIITNEGEDRKPSLLKFKYYNK